MRRTAALLLLASLLSFSLGCNGDPAPGKPSVTGVVYAPNGADPVPGATVSLYPSGGSAPSSAATRRALASVTPSATATSGPDGSFSLPGVPPGDYVVVVSFGLYEKSFAATVGADGVLYLDREATTLPAADGQDGGSAPRFAVVTGHWDDMGSVLAKFGLGQVDNTGFLVPGTETFDIYVSPNTETRWVWSEALQDWILSPALEGYPSPELLFGDPAVMQQYDVIVVNCGYSSQYLLDNADVRARIRDFVQLGGRLYVTDLSYDFVEQVFPAYLRFKMGGDGDPLVPEPPDAAEVGEAYTVPDGLPVTTEGAVPDPGLSAWLAGLGALNGDGTVHLVDFLGGWAVMDGPHVTAEGAQVKVWVRGSVPWYSLPYEQEFDQNAILWEELPLTVSFPCGAGKVIYTSYHTACDPHPGFIPQERILEYLVFESAR